jgi:hypothetical protein
MHQADMLRDWAWYFQALAANWIVQKQGFEGHPNIIFDDWCSAEWRTLLCLHCVQRGQDGPSSWYQESKEKHLIQLVSIIFTVQDVQGYKASKQSVAHLDDDGKEHNDDESLQACRGSNPDVLFSEPQSFCLAGSTKTWFFCLS